MDKCRLCMKYSKNLRCLFDTNSDGTSYATMITSMINVKISQEDGITNQICLACRRKTRELYDFKLQVESSYVALQNNCHLKKIYFSNISDIKFSIKILENDFKKPMPMDITENLKIKNTEGPFSYYQTIIKKVPVEEKKPLSVIDFLNSIKDETDKDYNDDDFSYEVEVDYDPDVKNDPDYKLQQQVPKKKYKPKFKTKKVGKENEMVLQNPIKPVYLDDYMLVPAKRPPRKVDSEKKYKLHICPYCGKMTKSLKSHLATHSDERPYKCEKCSNAYVTVAHLKNHIEKSHAPRTVKCDICVATFTNKSALKSHMISHSNEKKYECEVCHRAFKLKTHVIRHIRLVHNLGVKPCKCELCPDTFNSKYSLNHHMRVHTGERPYKCEICSQPYSYKHDFNRHCLKKHGVCFKRRTVHVMNEEVLVQERILMRDLMLRVNGILKDDKPINPFEGPQAALAFDQMMKAIQSGKVVVDLQL